MSSQRVLITAPTWRQCDGRHQDLLESSGLEPVFVERDIAGEDETIRLLEKNGPVIAIASDEKWSRRVLKAGKEHGLRYVSRHGTGTANVDLEAAAEFGIGVANTPGTTRIPVAEATCWLIGNALRDVTTSNTALHAGVYTRTPGAELFGRSVVLIGAGNIAQETAFRLAGFGASVTLAARTRNDRLDSFLAECTAVKTASSRFGPIQWLACPAKSVWQHVRKFDIVVAQVPLTPDTEGFIDDQFLGSLKPGALLGNMSRGALVASEPSVVSALDVGTLGGFFTDVFRVEPIGSRSDCPYLGHPKITVTPHVGWMTVENLGRQLGGAFENLWNALRDLPLPEERVWVVAPPASS